MYEIFKVFYFNKIYYFMPSQTIIKIRRKYSEKILST